MTDDPFPLPQGDGRCIACFESGDKVGERCPWKAKPSGLRLFCIRHWQAFLGDPNWPLSQEFEPYRGQLQARARASAGQAAGGQVPSSPSDARAARPQPQAGKTKDSKSSILSWLFDTKVIASVLLALAAFVSEFFFLLPFGIDYAFFIGTVESIPLFIRNLAFILIFCIATFVVVFASIIVVSLVFTMLLTLFRMIKLESLRFLINLAFRIFITRSSKAVVKLSSTMNLPRGVRGDVEILGRIDERIAGIYSLILEEWKIFRRNVSDIVIQLLGSCKKTLYYELFESFPPNFISKRPMVKVSLVLIVLIAPPAMRYMDGKTMALCARSLIGPPALMAGQVCPNNGSEDWLIYAGVDLSKLDNDADAAENDGGEGAKASRLDVKARALIDTVVAAWGMPLDVYGYSRTSTGALQGDGVEISAEDREKLTQRYGRHLVRLVEETQSTSFWSPVYRRVYAYLRRLGFPLVHNYPIVTLTFESAPAIFRPDAGVGWLQASCQMKPEKSKGGSGGVDAKVKDPVAEWSRAVLREPRADERACQLVDGAASARLLYLGEVGAWTMLYSLGPDGAPIFFKTKDIATISYKPVEVQSQTVEPMSPPEPQARNGGPVVTSAGPLDIKVGPIETTVTLDPRLLEATQSIGAATGELVAYAKDAGVRLDRIADRLERLSGRVEEVRIALGGSAGGAPCEEHSICHVLSETNALLESLGEQLQSETMLLSGRLSNDMNELVGEKLSAINKSLTSIERAVLDIDASDTQALQDEIVGLRLQIGGPRSSEAPADVAWEDESGLVGDQSGKLGGMPQEATDRTGSPSLTPDPAGLGDTGAADKADKLDAADNAGNAGNVFQVLAHINETFKDVATYLKHLQPDSADASLELPAIFVGVEKRIERACLNNDNPVRGAFPFERNHRRLDRFDADIAKELSDLIAAIADEAKNISDLSSEGDEAELLLVLIEGTADTTGSPQINREISEARATFIHDLLERRLEEASIGSGRNLTEKVVFASYGTGEWSYRAKSKDDVRRDQARFFKPRSVLVRLCLVPPSGEVVLKTGDASDEGRAN